jgi:bacillithiol biosynthesis cysteine-adding enzyme BshC
LPRGIADFYLQSETLAEATRKMVHHFYGKKNLIIIDGDDPALKKSFAEIMRKDLFENVFYQEVEQTNKKIAERNYPAQIHPRKINLFYLDENLRARIERAEDGFFSLVNTDIKFSEKEIAEILENEPEKFSPNVVLRPIYQEHILPNLSYSGGPAETIYWLQLKSAFEAASVPYPILLPRQFVMFLNENFSRKWFKAGLKEGDIFKTTEVLKKNFLANAEGQSLNFDDERKELTAFWEKIADKAETADRTLRDFVLAEGGKSLKSLENTERKIKKSLEIKHETAVKQIENLKDKIFPSGVPQERSDNFLTFYINRPDFLEEVFAHIKPFDLRFLTIWEQ